MISLRALKMQAVLLQTDGGPSIKARQRNAGLTWLVPPPFERQPNQAAAGSTAEDRIQEGRSDHAPAHIAAGAQRSAFDAVASSHLRSVVQHLLQAEHPEVPLAPLSADFITTRVLKACSLASVPHCCVSDCR